MISSALHLAQSITYLANEIGLKLDLRTSIVIWFTFHVHLSGSKYFGLATTYGIPRFFSYLRTDHRF